MGEGDSKHGRAKESPPVRPWLLVALYLALVAGLAVGGYTVWQRWFKPPPSADSEHPANAKFDAANGREQRARAAAELALAPLPSGPPLVARAGEDGDGYPSSYVDKVALKSLLGRGKYRELSAYIEQFERDGGGQVRESGRGARCRAVPRLPGSEDHNFAC
jgi:hypothetical protein